MEDLQLTSVFIESLSLVLDELVNDPRSFLLTMAEFLDRGGKVLYVIFALALLMWFLVLERFLYYVFSARHARQKLMQIWDENKARVGAAHIRESLQSALRHHLLSTFPLIKTLVKVTPMLGLLGTIYGMIEIFDVIGVQGTSDARSLANGISLATLPTMTGLAVGITGLFLLRYLDLVAQRSINRFNAELNKDETLTQN
ncbi:MAG: MotA/TolQ/ExbB proton channel family protein [Pseudomonadota bacterium]